jgi:hypothetical protein
MVSKLKIEWHCSNCKIIFRDYVTEFASLFGTSNKSTQMPGTFCGKILRGLNENEFTSLADDPNRQVVFFLDSMALNDLIGLGGLAILKRVGYPDLFVHELLMKGAKFKLFLTQASNLKKATWDNLLDCAQVSYPDWRERIDIARPLLKKLTYAEIMRSEGIVKDVRVFLRDILNVNQLFAGDGYTRCEGFEGQQIYAEYIVRNEKLSNLKSYALIEFPVEMSSSL